MLIGLSSAWIEPDAGDALGEIAGWGSAVSATPKVSATLTITVVWTSAKSTPSSGVKMTGSLCPLPA